MKYVGFVTVSKNPVKTRNLHGDISAIAGQVLPVLERNPEGDCLAILPNVGLVDVDHTDVSLFIESVKFDPMEYLLHAMKKYV